MASSNGYSSDQGHLASGVEVSPENLRSQIRVELERFSVKDQPAPLARPKHPHQRLGISQPMIVASLDQRINRQSAVPDKFF
jgi:hypothetical protein